MKQDIALEAESLQASGTVIIFNCVPAALTSITAQAGGGLDIQVLQPHQSIPAATQSSPWTSAVVIPRGTGPYQLPNSSQVAVYFDGETTPSWRNMITLPSTNSWLSFYLWCYVNGYILGDLLGNICSITWQIPNALVPKEE